MIGNYAIARGLMEAGIDIAAAYPGTPSSEILPALIGFRNREHAAIHTEWSTNERCAFEVAFGAALAGKKAACMMKQVGLNVAFPSLLAAREKRIEGSLVIICCDDPGPQSSQTEQDTRLLAALFGIPVLDPSSPGEAGDLAYHAVRYSLEKGVPVIVRPTHRVSHAREAVRIYPPGTRDVILDEGLVLSGSTELGVIASGMCYALVSDVIGELDACAGLSLYKVTTVVPALTSMTVFARSCTNLLILEETDQVIEAQVAGLTRTMGRRTGHVPSAGELTYDRIRTILQSILVDLGIPHRTFVPDESIEKAVVEMTVSAKGPRLCAGCAHRASFFAMRKAFPDALFPGDIGCYTLGISMGAVDTCLDMGAGVTLAAGLYDTYRQDGVTQPIVASIGDSTFFHACLAPLYDAVKKNKQFVLVIMDNSTTAMTGFQPTPQSGITADGQRSEAILIENVLAGLGVPFVAVTDPYDVPATIGSLKDAFNFLKEAGSGPAVVITRRECLLRSKGTPGSLSPMKDLVDRCTGCGQCRKIIDCPALLFDEERKSISIDERLCTGCGLCRFACTVTDEGRLVKKLTARHTMPAGDA